jgi:hypothetical protein
MHRNWSKQLKVRTLKSPRYFATNRRKVCHGANSITWANTSLPTCITASRINPGSLPQSALGVQIVYTPKVTKDLVYTGFPIVTYEICRTVLNKYSYYAPDINVNHEAHV